MFNGQTVADWLSQNVVIILMVLAGASILIASLNKKPRDAFLTFGIGLLALLFLALGSQWQAIGTWLQGIVGGAPAAPAAPAALAALVALS